MSRLFSGTPFERPISCPECHQAAADCRCLHLPDKKRTTGTPNKKPPRKPGQLDSGLTLTPQNSKAPADQLARVRTEKRKGNRVITVVAGLDHPANDLPALCTALKQTLGVGGSVQGRTIELQGDHAQKVAAFLQSKNIKARAV